MLEEALGRLLQETVRITGAARTDTGVHATGQVINFRMSSALLVERIRRGANALLPRDVAILELAEVGDDFHARNHATSRTYEYAIWNGRTPRPLLRRTSLWVEDPLDVEAMRRASVHLVGRHDYSAFAMKTSGRRERRVRRAEWRAAGEGMLVFEIEATGFLRGMVRGIVGTLLRVGHGKLHADEFASVLASADRGRAGPAAPAHGLCLVRVAYQGREAPYDETGEGTDE